MTIAIYDGAIQANDVGSFIKAGFMLRVIRPGYCIQGKRRPTWTQFVHDGIPIYEIKVAMPLEQAIAKFEKHWDDRIGNDTELAARALAATAKKRRETFRDGVTAEVFAPSTTQDGLGDGYVYHSS